MNVSSAQNVFNRCLLNKSVLFLLNPTSVQAGQSWDSFTGLFKMKRNWGHPGPAWRQTWAGALCFFICFNKCLCKKGTQCIINTGVAAQAPALNCFPFMRRSHRALSFKMALCSPSIPSPRAGAELGRCLQHGALERADTEAWGAQPW